MNFFLRQSGLALVMIFILSACTIKKAELKAGMISLDLNNQEVINLSGEWDFYWDTLLMPSQIRKVDLKPEYIPVPSSWTELGYPAFGKATYQATILGLSGEKSISFNIPKIWSRSKVWINDKLVCERGELYDKEGENLIIESIILPPKISDTTTITIQVSNYDLFIGGLVHPVKVGVYNELLSKKISTNFLQVFWMGCLGIIGLYHLLLFQFNIEEKAYGFLGIICLLLVAKVIVFGDHHLYDMLKLSGFMNFKWQATIYYVSTYMVAGIGCLYIHELYPCFAKRKMSRFLFVVIALYCLFVILTPKSIFIHSLLYFQVIVGIALIYILTAIVRGFFDEPLRNVLQLFGIIFVLMAAANDAFYDFGLKSDMGQELLPYSFSTFVLLQIVHLAFINRVKSKRITKLINTLERRVEDRTLMVNKQKKELEQQNEELKSLNDEKDHLMSVVAHDLKKPINDIASLVYFSDNYKDNIPEELGEILRIMGNSVNRYTKMVNKVLDLNAIKEKSLNLEPETINLNECTKETVRDFREQARHKKITIEHKESEGNAVVSADRIYLTQVFENLLSNSIKYSPLEAHVIVSVEKTEGGFNVNFIDHGPGICQHDKETLFKPFERLSNKPTANESSSGLGLSIAKRYIEAMGGEIRCDSEVGKGSTFVVFMKKERASKTIKL